MPRYTYKAVDTLGKVYKDIVEIDSKEELISNLKYQNLMPIEIKKLNFMNTDLKQFKIFKPKISIKDLSIFCKQFSTILDAGIPVITALDILKNQIENTSLKNILNGVYKNLQSGYTLSQSMKPYSQIPKIMINIVEAGEISGKLNIAFKQLANQYDKSLNTEYKIKKAITYPIIISLLMLAVITVVITFVIPVYANMFDQMQIQLPKITLIFIYLSEFIINKGYILLISAIVFIITVKLLLNCTKVKYALHKFILKVPILNHIIIEINTMRFATNMSILLSSDIPIIESLQATYRLLQNYIFKQAIQNIILSVAQGMSISESIQQQKVFPYILVSMIRVGEQTACLDTMLDKTANFFEQSVEAKIEQLTIFIEPIMTILIASIMGFIMLAILMPTFSMATQAL